MLWSVALRNLCLLLLLAHLVLLLIFRVFVGNSSSNLILNQSQTLSKLNPNHEATETLESPPKPSEPYFIVPPGFRANTFFVGMEKELQLLDKNLFDVRQRRVGTACVLLHGQPGGGKSHLARQYVHKNRKKFKGGIFWIQAKSKEERHQAFWIIYQKVVARLSPEACIQVNGDERSYVESVKAWFEARSEWLIVFDGVVLDKDEDTHEFQSFVPDSKSSSIIYISRAKNLESKQRLLRPYAIRVPPLKEDDARKLLFKELHIKKPTDAQAKSAKTLVKQIGGLPLAIAAISHRLADTHEPLSKFSFKSYSTDPTIGGTFNKILDDLQRVGHMEAWNLMNILCFYGQHIPVEMINLGLKALRAYPVEVKSNETGGKPDINISIGILMRYALIERNEPDDKDSKSSSRDSLVGPEPIDMLKIQSVIQKFCCDSLNAKNLLPQWLEKAVRLFSYSFQQADIKIKQKPEPGRVSDYHYYLVHGKRLVDHCTSYDSKNQRLDSIRGELDAVLEKIEQEIQNREPTSSQESISRGIFQISVFDRTSSGSESGPSIQEARTPDNRPTALLLNENEFGMDIQKPSVDSPASFRTTSPNFEPRIVANSPSLKLPGYYDPGYESDRGDFFSPLETNKTRSEGTARPQASSTESQGEGWQIVAPTRKPKKQPRRDLGTFRPTPARATVDRMSVSGSVARPAPNFDERRPSSDAFALLSEVQHRSPPRSQNGGASFWQRRPSGQSPVQHSRQTYAGVAARRPQPQSPPDINLPQSTGYDETLPGPTQMACGGSSESYRSRPAQFPSFPLSSESVPHQRQAEGVFDDDARSFAPLRVMNINDPGQHPQDPHYTFGTSASHISSSSRPRYINENINPNLSSSLPYDQEYPSSSKRPFGLSFQPPTRPFSQSPHSSSHPSLNALRLTGYYSQPMSRHTSRHSQPSLPETEPVRHTARFSSHPNSPPPGDRNRYPDGRPLPKSPKTSMPSFHEKSAPYDTTYDLSGTGGWAYPTPPPTSAVAIRDLDLAMSRSSSGPGVALSGAAGEGLGIIRFDGPGSVQFGELAPVSVEDARRRAMEHEAKLRAEEGMRGRTGYDRRRELDRTAYETRAWSEERDRRRPYPDFNLIPTNTDPVALGMMDLG